MHVHANSKVLSWYINKLGSYYIEHDQILTTMIVCRYYVSAWYLYFICYHSFNIMVSMGIISGLLQKSLDKACD